MAAVAASGTEGPLWVMEWTPPDGISVPRWRRRTVTL